MIIIITYYMKLILIILSIIIIVLSSICLKFKENFEESELKEVDITNGGNKLYITFHKNGENIVYMDSGKNASFLLKYKNCKEQNCFNTQFTVSLKEKGLYEIKLSGGSHIEGKFFDTKLIAPQINISPDEKGVPLRFEITKTKFGYYLMEKNTKQFVCASNNNILIFGDETKALNFSFLKYT